MSEIAAHFMIGLIGAATGWWARSFCPHPIKHQLPLTLGLVLLESIVVVQVVG